MGSRCHAGIPTPAEPTLGNQNRPTRYKPFLRIVTTMDGLQYYVRQFRNMKGTIPIDAMDAAALTDYAGVVGQLLAKGHARTSGASMISGYMGRSDRVDTALH